MHRVERNAFLHSVVNFSNKATDKMNLLNLFGAEYISAKIITVRANKWYFMKNGFLV
jgi:hypothetical protein